MKKKDMRKVLDNMSKSDALINLKEHKKILFVIAAHDVKEPTKMTLESYVLLSGLSQGLKDSIRTELGLKKPEPIGEGK